MSLSRLDLLSSQDNIEVVLEMNMALQKLHATYPRVANVVVLRYFFGHPETEIAANLGVSERTVRNDCRFAYARLGRELAAPGEGPGEPGV